MRMLPILSCAFLAPPRIHELRAQVPVSGRSVAVYALSRGAGVPTQTRPAFAAIRHRLKDWMQRAPCFGCPRRALP